MSSSDNKSVIDSEDSSSSATVRLDANSATTTANATTRLDATTRVAATAGDPNATVRLDAANTSDATVRIANAAGSMSHGAGGAADDATVRLSGTSPDSSTVRVGGAGSAASNDATQRLGGGAADGNDATVRLSGNESGPPSAAAPAPATGAMKNAPDMSGMAAMPSVTGSASRVLQPGDTLTLKGIAYTVKRIISVKGGEANTYWVANSAGEDFALKQYKNNAKAPMDVLQSIQRHPHPNVVALRDFGTEHGFDYELQELVQSGNLEQLLEKGPIREVERLKVLVRGIVDGLQHLHGVVDIIYQDLKPSNILVSGKAFKKVYLSDFGISTRRNGAPEDARIDVIANVTAEYAAPELARIGNHHKTTASNKVDYYALGITLWECWEPHKPFKQLVAENKLRDLIQDGKLELPSDMDLELAKLIKGLLAQNVTERYNHEQINQWLRGEAIEDKKNQLNYKRTQFLGSEFFSNKKELVALMEKYPAKGIDHFYAKMIENWLQEAGDMEVLTSLHKIHKGYDKDNAPELRAAGVKQFIYILDPDKPFVGPTGKEYKYDDFGLVLLDNYQYYLNELKKNPYSDFYMYLKAHNEEDYANNLYSSFTSQGVDARRTLNEAINALVGGQQNRFYLQGQYFTSPSELGAIPQDVLLQELCTDHSRTLLWLKDLGLISDSLSLQKLSAYDLLVVCKQISGLNPQKIQPNIVHKAEEILRGIASNSNHDLLGLYTGLGLDFKFDEAIFCAIEEGDMGLASLMLQQGANPNAVSSKGYTVLQLAAYHRSVSWIRLLHQAGADPNLTTEKFKASPLDWALTVNKSSTPDVSIAAVHALLEAGADPNMPSDDNALPLHTALFYSNASVLPEAIELLIQKGADIHKMGRCYTDAKQVCNALFSAVYALKATRSKDAFSSQQAIKALDLIVEAGADVRKMHLDKTVLHYAAEHNMEGLVDWWLQKKLPLDFVNSDRMLPISYAAANGHQALEQKLAGSITTKVAFKSHWMRFVGFLALIPFSSCIWRVNEKIDGAIAAALTILCVIFFRVLMADDGKQLLRGLTRNSLKQKFKFLAGVGLLLWGLNQAVANAPVLRDFSNYSAPMLFNFFIVLLIATRFAINPGLEVAAYRRYRFAKQKGSQWWLDGVAALVAYVVLVKIL